MSKWRDLGDVGTVGIEFIVSIGVCYFAGHWLDVRYFGGHGYGDLAGFAFGLVVAFRAIVMAGRRATLSVERVEREEREKREQRAAERELYEQREKHERSRERNS